VQFITSFINKKSCFIDAQKLNAEMLTSLSVGRKSTAVNLARVCKKQRVILATNHLQMNNARNTHWLYC